LVHISVLCPSCGARYQLDPSLRGKQMRCPNTACRAVFEVREESETPPPPAAPPKVETPAPPTTGHIPGGVGDVVPILRAEAVAEPPPATAPPASAEMPPVRDEKPPKRDTTGDGQRQPPPVRARGITVPTAPTESPSESDFEAEFAAPEPAASGWGSTVSEAALADGLHEISPGAWDAPPVRDGPAVSAESIGAPMLAPATTPTSVSPQNQVLRGRRRSRWLMAALLLLLGGGLGLATWAFLLRRAGNEEERLKQAEKLYADRDFAEAARILQGLQRDFPDSPNFRLYGFLAELSGVRESVYQSEGDADKAYESFGRLLQCLEIYKDDPLLKAREPDIWMTLHRIAKELSEGAQRTKEARLVDRAWQAMTEMSKYKDAAPPESRPKEALRDLERALAEVKGAIATGERRQEFLTELKNLVATASAQSVQQGRALVARADLTNDTEAQALLKELVKAHVAGVTYTRVMKGIEAPTQEEPAPSLLLAPLRGKTNPVAVKDATVFGLAHGVFYALDARDGAPRWALRLGADSTVPPLRLPPTPLAPEAVLLVSADHNTLSAHDVATGATLWRHALRGACVASPLRAGRHLLVPTVSGRVEEIEIAGGKLLGAYPLGQPLSAGAVFDENTSLAYFPAEDFCVYIIDVARKTCAGVLYAGHARASVKLAPIIVHRGTPKGSKAAGALLLLHASAVNETTLRAYELPIADPDQLPIEPGLRLPGRIDFPPYLDGERLAVATDAGVLTVLGHPSRKGFPLFRPFAHDFTFDRPGKRPAAALIAHAAAESFWVVSGGGMRRVQAVFSDKEGPKLVPRGPLGAVAGTPLQPAQAFDDLAGHTTLFLSAQERRTPTCFLHAIGANGVRHWDRQLGVVAADVVALGDTVCMRDAHGLFTFERKHLDGSPSKLWLSGEGKRFALPEGIADTRILAHENGAYVVTWSKSGPALSLTHVSLAGETSSAAGQVPLAAAVAGPPALGKDALIVPLENGLFVHVSLSDHKATPGPNWPGADVEELSPRYVTQVGAADFLATDGYSGWKVYQWPQANQVSPLAGSEHKLSQRIAAAPAALGVKEAPPYQVAVADAGGRLQLLQGPPWKTVRTWSLGGKITGGPWLRGKHLACVVDRRRVVWIDPERAEPVWEFSAAADLVGAPQLVGDLVVIADVAGQFLGLDATTGRLRGSYVLRAQVTAAVAPVPIGADRLFAPLTDGTVLLIPLKHLQ
jgi:outer membrane protein assembly factor BamB